MHSFTNVSDKVVSSFNASEVTGSITYTFDILLYFHSFERIQLIFIFPNISKTPITLFFVLDA